MSGVRVCGRSELAHAAARRVVVYGRPVALVRTGDRFHAIPDFRSPERPVATQRRPRWPPARP